MSLRFGRNKRRAARERIAILAREAGQFKSAYDMATALSIHQGRTIDQLKAEISDAKEIAGRMSVLFPATEFRVDDNQKHFQHLEVGCERPLGSIFDCGLPATMETQRLTVMLGRIDRNTLLDAVHVRMMCGNEDVGYAMSPSVIASTPKSLLVRRCVESVGRIIAEKLHKALK